MHVCMVTPEFPPKLGGIANYVYNLSKILVEKGHNVSVITRGTWKKSVVNCIEGVDVYKTQFIPIYPFHVQLHGVYTRKLFKFLESELDVIHLHIGLQPPIRTSLPIVVTVHTVTKMEDYTTKLMDFRSLAEKLLAKFVFSVESKTIHSANIITAVSDSVRKELQKYYGIEAKTVRIVANGVDANFFIPKTCPHKKAPYILYTGRLNHGKGLLDLVKSAAYVCREHPEASFVLTGEGPYGRRLRKLVDKKGLSKKFSFVGLVDRNNLLKYYQNATIYVLPSYYEGLPTAILEAMACGIPVVATSVSGIPEVVVEGKTGFLVLPKDHKMLGKAIVKLLDDERLRNEMGKAARERIEKFYTWHNVAEKALECYESLI